MSEYSYPDGAIKSQDELVRLVEQGKKEPFRIWLVRPKVSAFDGPNPAFLWLNKQTEFKRRFNPKKEYAIDFGVYSYWSPINEACFPYGVSDNTHPDYIGYMFLNYWMAVGWAIRTNTFSQAA